LRLPVGSIGGQQKRLNPLVFDDAVGAGKTGKNILSLQPWITGEKRLRTIARDEHAEDMLVGKASTTVDRLAAEDFRIDGSAAKVDFRPSSFL
jgi:hypothetical protein